MTYAIEYNARGVPASDVARTFIPPEPHFVQLLSRNHALLLGPRGSGKTTLLKMLTVRALSSWNHPLAIEIAKQVGFNAAFVAADVSWGKQIDSLDLGFYRGQQDAAFVLHTLRALVFAMREAVELERRGAAAHLRHLAVKMAITEEETFVKSVSESFSVKPPINSLLGLELALEQELDSIYSGARHPAFSVNTFPAKISFLISAFNGFTSQNDRRWALLFDELEIAPTRIKSFLLAGLRSLDERVVFKLALAPFMDDVGLDQTPTSPNRAHDYHTIQLTYANKANAIKFSTDLFVSTFQRFDIEAEPIERLFNAPQVLGGGRGKGQAQQSNKMPAIFYDLARKDDSFRRYAEERGLFSSKFKFSEETNAQFIRKILPIVTVRDYYLKKFESMRVVRDRSRKSYSLYSGYPSVVEITEGNPRAILTFVGPLAQQLLGLSPGSRKRGPVPRPLESQAIKRVELLLTSLLQVIPLDMVGFRSSKGLLDFVDQIGRAFEQRLLRRSFTADYVGSFFVDQSAAPLVVSAVGKALNAGALVHVPHPDSGPDSLLRGLRGQRFRISYALAARYRLLLTLGDSMHLSELMRDIKGVSRTDPQLPMFKEEDNL